MRVKQTRAFKVTLTGSIVVFAKSASDALAEAQRAVDRAAEAHFEIATTGIEETADPFESESDETLLLRQRLIRMQARHAAGRSNAEIATEFNISRQRVSQIFAAAADGRLPRQYHKRDDPARLALIRELQHSGLTRTEIGRRIGCSGVRVGQLLRLSKAEGKLE